MEKLDSNSPAPGNKSFHDPVIKQDLELDLQHIFRILKRRKRVIINTVLVTILLSLIFIFIQKPLYTAESVLQFSLRNNNVVDIESVMSGLSSDSAALESEVDVIKSHILIGQVIEKLELRKNKEFDPEIMDKSIISTFFEWITSSEVSEEELKRREHNLIVEKVLKNLEVNRSPRSYTVTVKYTSESAEMAAKIANAIVDEYLIDQLNTHFQATKRANEWISERMSSLRKKVRDSQMAVQKFREEHDLVNFDGKFGTDNQLSELNSHLIIARTARAQAEARLEQTREIINSNDDTASIAEVLSSELISKLREQESEVLRKKSELESRYGPRHPLMIKVRAEIDNINDNIEREIKKIILGIEYEVSAAKIKEKSMEKSLENLRKKLNTTNKFEMQLTELLREMEANQHLYDSFLVRFKETSEDQSYSQNNARIIAVAQIPEKPSWPKKKIILALAIILGAGIGVLVVFAIEHFDNVFRNGQQVEEIIGIPAIGMIPELAPNENPIDYAINKVTSAFAESLRSTATAVHFSNPDNPPKSIVVTSSTPKEGKSVFASSLARLMAKSGAKVLLVDCDMRLPSIHKYFGIELKKGLGDLLTNGATLKEIIAVDKKSGLHYIRSFHDTPYSQELLGSKKMEEFIRMAEKSYDMVILDTPPVMALSDSIVLSCVADATVLLARWEKTPRNVVKESVKRISVSGINIAGIVLSRVDMEKQAEYDYGDAGYYYGKYRDYYTS